MNWATKVGHALAGVLLLFRVRFRRNAIRRCRKEFSTNGYVQGCSDRELERELFGNNLDGAIDK